IENDRYDATMLSQPGPEAAQAAGEASWTNATHLLVNEPGHARFVTFLRGADLGWEKPEGDDVEDVYVVQTADGRLAPHTVGQPATLAVEPRTVTLASDGSVLQVCSS